MNMRLLFIAMSCTLFAASCKQKQVMQKDVSHGDTIEVAGKTDSLDSKQRYVAMEHPCLYLEKDSGSVFCYADSQRITFNDEYLDNGAMAMMIYPKGRYAYVIGDIVPNSDGWTVRYHLYQIDTQTLETKHIGDFAAIRFEDNGFKTAITRLTNPEATCTAEEVFAIHDVYFNEEGQQIRESKTEYRYDEMERMYGDSLVNANGFRY